MLKMFKKYIFFAKLKEDYFLINDMYLPSLLSKRAVFNLLVQNDAQSSETTEKSIFRFLVSELFLILFTIFKCFYRPNMEKKLSQNIRNVLEFLFVRFLVSES